MSRIIIFSDREHDILKIFCPAQERKNVFLPLVNIGLMRASALQAAVISNNLPANKILGAISN